MYWLLRAGEQGSEEAVEVLTGMAANGRGVTDQNYVDVVNITSVPKNITKSNFIAKKLFKKLSNGNTFLTSLQLSRLVNENTKIPTQPIKNAKCSQDDLIDNCCEYMEGELPSLDQSLHVITAEYGFIYVFSSQFFIISCILAL